MRLSVYFHVRNPLPVVAVARARGTADDGRPGVDSSTRTRNHTHAANQNETGISLSLSLAAAAAVAAAAVVAAAAAAASTCLRTQWYRRRQSADVTLRAGESSRRATPFADRNATVVSVHGPEPQYGTSRKRFGYEPSRSYFVAESYITFANDECPRLIMSRRRTVRNTLRSISLSNSQANHFRV